MANILIPEKDTPKFLIALLLLAGSLCFGTMGALILVLNNRSLATMERTYVQMSDGTAHDIVQVDPLHREPGVLKSTAESFLQLMFEWDNKLPNGEKDAGVSVVGVKVPSKVYMGSFLMEPQFRTEFLKLMGSQIIPKAVLDGFLESSVVIYEVSEPVEIAPGRWEVRVLAARFETNNRGEQGQVIISRRISLKAIPKQVSVLLPADQTSPFRESLRLLLRNKVMVTSVVEDGF
ncbi:hypothetical protein [Okeania sp. SIO2B3]|uniref:hypothetical protein n=1 Tax=Okeania sp. SIO2B3 TaxID=2607784 RepID=UPI0013C26F2E|nr:hypothetical protein [Okeania sp. SIO2B3]NET45982.1 hypothetical protein [Okeania sp. SIO2B3]